MSNGDTLSTFFQTNLPNLPKMLQMVKEFLNDITQEIQEEPLFLILSVLKEFCNDLSKIDEYLPLADQDKSQAKTKELLLSFLTEEGENVIKYFNERERKRKSNYKILTKFNWKFIGLSNSDNFPNGVIVPKILVCLEFNDGTQSIFESDFATIKKLQEEIEECLSSFNSTYTRRIENFAK